VFPSDADAAGSGTISSEPLWYTVSEVQDASQVVGILDERVTEKLNINQSSVRRTETILCCL
jgi:hypothetical protein